MAGSGYTFQKYVNDARRFKKRACVLSIGDSWFQYALRSFPDLQRRIELDLYTKLLMLDNSHPGRDAKNLVSDVIPEVTSWAAFMQQEKRPFKAILVSLGGNDIIGKDFAHHLKKATEPADPGTQDWSSAPAVAQRHIRFSSLEDSLAKVQAAYKAVLALRDANAPGAPVICHTYADVTPCNVPYEFFGFTAGPWLWGPMLQVKLTDPQAQRELSRWLLATFSRMLTTLAKKKNMVVLDSRTELPEFKGSWDNEIHPSKGGFEYLAREYWVPEVTNAI